MIYLRITEILSDIGDGRILTAQEIANAGFRGLDVVTFLLIKQLYMILLVKASIL